ncbi:hypothetical protein MLD38_036019 [Melastoma candidum]|uniref:Uncharacterized protein n=1 Tax=Melastoma candidum TaxID=119954 RepID=A0ACB9LIT1_9MYRT|nr:hypothetical protein MLD38_036019 [Melastoma candidum]
MLALYEARVEEVLFGCGFHCTGINCKNGSYTFSIFIASNPAKGLLYIHDLVDPRVVWSSNRDHPVGINATLEFTGEGDLVLKDADGSVNWSTGTSGKSVVAMNLTDGGNLVLLDGNNKTVWQSFDYPTDTLLLGQSLRVGQKLTHTASQNNPTKGGLFVLSLTISGLSASIQSNLSPPLAYFSMSFAGRDSSYVRLANGSLDFAMDDDTNRPVIDLPHSSAVQFVNLGSSGHLRLYDYSPLNGAVELADLLGLDPCHYPTACGNYGVCSQGNCTCPASTGRNNYLEERNPEHPDRGCSVRGAPLTCKASESRTFLEIPNLDYFNFVSHFEDVDLEKCKEACAKNCSCMAVLYRASPDKSKKWCFLPSEVLSMINVTNASGNYTAAYIKVQRDLSEYPRADDKRRNRRIFLASIFAAAVGFLILVTMFVLQKQKKKKKKKKRNRVKTKLVGSSIEHIPGLLMRFTYAELEKITKNFSEKLGEGGFSNVYEGMLHDGTKVAVKRIDGSANMAKYIFAEVKVIGSIHHANLVRLLGFCADESHRLLVYEYMSNGSLDKWIFAESEGCHLPTWEKRRNIILDVARGLHYLHEECHQKIVHCDIKPQNILLDKNFRAKVSDFGLSKPIDRDQSRVMTALRGTPGYLAPEWLSGAITEKVDIYSFGMVILDIVCGKRVFSQLEDDQEGTNLLELLQRTLEEGSLLHMIDQKIEDVDEASVTSLLKVSAWCLQPDFRKRPSMSMVINVLEGASITMIEDLL